MGEFIGDGLFATRPLTDGFFVEPNAARSIVDPQRLILIADRDDAEDHLSKLTINHGRSFVDKTGKVFTGESVTDENGDVYVAFNTKGNDFTFPVAYPSNIEPNGVKIIGAQEAALLERCRLASSALRFAGVLCEWPIYTARPANFPVAENKQATATTSTNLLGIKYGIYGILDQLEPRSLARAAVEVGIADTTFGVSYRAMLTNYRLGDIGEVDDHRQVVTESIAALQARRPTHLGIWDEIAKLDPKSSGDIDFYLTKVLPKIIGENLGRMHNEGLYHKYPHISNWSLAGEIVDLDSVSGSTIFSEDKHLDLDEILNDISVTINAISDFGKKLDQNSEGGFNAARHTSPAASFIEAYFSTRFTEADEVEQVVLEALLYSFSDDERKYEIEPKTFIDFLGWEFGELSQTAVDVFMQVLEKSAVDPDKYKDEKEIHRAYVTSMYPHVVDIVEHAMRYKTIADNRQKTVVDFVVKYECSRLFSKVAKLLVSLKPDTNVTIELH